MEEEPINVDEYEIPEEEIKKDSKSKQIIIAIIAAFLISLVVSLIIFSGSNFSLILGLIDSSKVKDYKIELKNVTVEFDKSTYKELVKHYKESEGKEINVCLLGERSENLIFINKITYPKIISQSYRHVESEYCPEETIIYVHSHPNRQCLPSEQDEESYEFLKQQHKDALAAVMCEESRLNFYIIHVEKAL